MGGHSVAVGDGCICFCSLVLGGGVCCGPSVGLAR